MDEEEDVKRITEVLNKTKAELENFEYEEFIDYEDGDSDVDIEEITDDIFILPESPTTDLSKFSSLPTSITLTEEEQLVINSCQEPELKQLLMLNRNKNLSLIKTFKKVKDMLLECQHNITAKREHLKAMKTTKIRSSRSWRLAAPYFKDKELFPCPQNPDIIRQNQNKEYFHYDMVPILKWSKIEIQKLLNAVRLNYNVNVQKDLLYQIADLKKDTAFETNEQIENDIVELQKKYDIISSAEEFVDIPELNSDKFIDWESISDTFFKRRFTALECKTFWHIYAHPNINKSTWSQKENETLKNIVDKYNCQNWEKINAELNTGRTPFLTGLHYFSNLSNKIRKNMKYTQDEDNRIMSLVNQYRSDSYIPWSKIVRQFKGRTRSQLFYRYKYYLLNTKVKKGKFTECEDILLMILVDKFGRNFTKCAEYVTNRSPVQLKARYTSNLAQFIKKGTFTEEDDQAIIDHVKEYGEGKWHILKQKIFRCRNQLTQRLRVIKYHLKDNPNATVQNVPRRQHRQIAPEKDSYQFLRMIADKFTEENIIPTYAEIRKALKQTPTVGLTSNQYDSSDSSSDELDLDPIIPDNLKEESSNNEEECLFNIDDMLIDFFSNSFQLDTSNSSPDYQVGLIAECVTDILHTFQVNLEIPNDYHLNNQLDNLDIAILNNLCNDAIQLNGKYLITTFIGDSADMNITSLIPPNVNTLVGLRSLLIKYVTQTENMRHIFDPLNEVKSEKQLRWCLSKYIHSLDADDQTTVVIEREMFFKRFLSIFKFPAIMTVHPPSKALLATSNYWKYSSPLESKRTYQKKYRIEEADIAQHDRPDFVEIVDGDIKSEAKPVKILQGVNLKDIKTVTFNNYGRVTKLENIVVRNNQQPKKVVNAPPILRIVTDKNIIKQLKQKIQTEIDGLSKAKSQNPVFKQLNVPKVINTPSTPLLATGKTYKRKKQIKAIDTNGCIDLPNTNSTSMNNTSDIDIPNPILQGAIENSVIFNFENDIEQSLVADLKPIRTSKAVTSDNQHKPCLINQDRRIFRQNESIDAGRSVTEGKRISSNDVVVPASNQRNVSKEQSKDVEKNVEKILKQCRNRKRTKNVDNVEKQPDLKKKKVDKKKNTGTIKLENVERLIHNIKQEEILNKNYGNNQASSSKSGKFSENKIKEIEMVICGQTSVRNIKEELSSNDILHLDDPLSNKNRVFDVGRGELLVEDTEENEDVKDLNMLEVFLKKQQMQSIDDELDYDIDL